MWVLRGFYQTGGDIDLDYMLLSVRIKERTIEGETWFVRNPKLNLLSGTVLVPYSSNEACKLIRSVYNFDTFNKLFLRPYCHNLHKFCTTGHVRYTHYLPTLSGPWLEQCAAEVSSLKSFVSSGTILSYHSPFHLRKW